MASYREIKNRKYDNKCEIEGKEGVGGGVRRTGNREACSTWST